MRQSIMNRFAGLVLTLALAATFIASRGAAQSNGAGNKPLRGYSEESARQQVMWEEKLRAIPQPDRLREHVKHMSAEPHHIGSAYGKQNAEYIRDQFRSWGFEAELEEFEVLVPFPKERMLEMVAPTRFRATLKEPELAEDPDSSDKGQLPTYNAYSADGDVTGELVYVNYGLPSDYEELRKLGIDVKGKIVIARYGASWRGIKPKVAYENGAIGCIIYSDPRDDGYYQGDVYPAGPYRPEHGVQRGSVMDMPIHPGDPLTPGWGAVRGARRIAREESEVIMKIPVLPISYADALPLLKALGGPVAPEAWRGALPITYHVGPGPARVRLKLDFDWGMRPLYNVIAKMTGSQYPDQWLVYGNHHDAWVNGASDPVSGMATVLEAGRAIGELAKQGWRPKRTLVFCAWDGEEPSLLGSTEWAETHAAELKQKAVLYLNSDSTGKGFLNIGGSHSLERFVNEVARDVNDPVRKKSLLDAMRERRLRMARSEEDRKELRERADLRIGALGSGSDYTPFIQHLGIASLNTGIGGESGGGVYHSVYDSFTWYTRFSDGTFEYGRALAQYNATLIMRMANADVLPFEFTNLADTVGRYSEDLEQLAARSGAPKPIRFDELKQAVRQLNQSATRYEEALRKAAANGFRQVKDFKALNELLYLSERRLTTDAGLPRRPWYKHTLYAPGLYTGYGVKTIPGVREAIEQKHWNEVEPQMKTVAAALTMMAAQIDQAARMLEGR